VRVGKKQFSVYGKTAEEAYLALVATRKKVGAGWQPPAPATLAQLLEQWMEAHPEWKPRTRHEYQSLAARWVLPVLGNLRLNQLQPKRIEALIHNLTPRQGTKVFALLRAALRAAERWGLVEQNPMRRVTPPSYAPARKDLPPVEQMAAALKEGRGHRWWSWVALAVSTGLRPGEQAALRWEDWEQHRGILWVRRNGQWIDGQWVETSPKTAAGVRRLSLPALALEALRLQAAEHAQPAGSDLIFSDMRGKPWHYREISEGIQRFFCPYL
jgi:integrase